MTIYELLTDEQLGIPVSYGFFSNPPSIPYICIIGAGQTQFEADNTYYTKQDNWQIELYFKQKDPEVETAIEEILLSNGYKYTKSEDVYIDSERIFYVYYTI